jgi:hypothetical protein
MEDQQASAKTAETHVGDGAPFIVDLAPLGLVRQDTSGEVSKALFFDNLIFSITMSGERPACTMLTTSSLVSGFCSVAATPAEAPASSMRMQQAVMAVAFEQESCGLARLDILNLLKRSALSGAGA